MSPQNARFATLVRALRGTPEGKVVTELLHALRMERQQRKRIERLRRDQSTRLFEAAHDAAVLKHEAKR